MRAHLEHLARSGKRHPLLDPQPVPPTAAHLWEIFWQLGSARASNGFGLNPISYVEIGTWCELNLTPLEPWEVRAIKAMDMAFLKEYAEVNKRGN